MTVTAHLTSYTSVSASVQFELTIQPCIVTGFEISPPLSPDFDYSYEIGDTIYSFSVPDTVAT